MSSKFTLNLDRGSLQFDYTPEAARQLQAELQQLMQGLKAIAAQPASGGSRPQPQPTTEYCYRGDVFFEIFCNPNIYPTPFAAKVLLTLRDERLRLSVEAELPRLVEDLNQYLEQVG